MAIHEGFHHGFRSPVKPQPRMAKLDPRITTKQMTSAYRVTLAAPAGASIGSPSAFIEGRALFLQGQISADAGGVDSTEYLVVQRTGLYAQPSRRALIEVVHPRTVVKGGEPSRAGWIQLEDGYWMLSDAVQRVSPPPPPPRRFVKRVDLPDDAVLDAAVDELGECEYVVMVPRRRKSPSQAPERFGPPVPPRPSGTSPRSRSEASSAPATGAPTWIQEIQSACFAEDLKVPPMANTWSEAEVRAYFESGGKLWPSRGAAAGPYAASAPDVPQVKAAHPKMTEGGTAPMREALPKSEPVLTEAVADIVNVQTPEETCQYWHATPSGGFAPAPGM